MFQRSSKGLNTSVIPGGNFFYMIIYFYRMHVPTFVG